MFLKSSRKTQEDGAVIITTFQGVNPNSIGVGGTIISGASGIGATFTTGKLIEIVHIYESLSYLCYKKNLFVLFTKGLKWNAIRIT